MKTFHKNKYYTFFHSTTLGHCILLGFFGFIHFFWLSHAYGLMHNNEGLYAQIPVEMLQNKAFIIPTLNGVPYIEKPPLLYWLVAIVYKIAGISETTARVIPALSGFMTCMGLYYMGYQHNQRETGFIAALMLMGSVAFVIFSRMVYFEGLLTFTLTTALLLFYQASLTYSKKGLMASYIFLALAILTKGFVALILYGCVVMAWIIYRRSFVLFRWLFSPLPLGVFIILCAPWHVAAHFQDADFSWFYFINEHILRFLGKREPKDYYHGPFYYYTYRLLLYGLPWTGLVYAVKKYPTTPLTTFLSLWALIFFVFFSLSSAKANYYIMTLMPPLAYIMAHGLVFSTLPRSMRWLPLGFFLIISIGMLVGYYKFVFIPPFVPFCIMGLLGVYHGLTSLSLKKLSLSLTVQVTCVILTLLKGMPQFDALVSARSFSREEGCLYRDYEKMSSVVFYMKQPLLIYNSLSNDLAYGLLKKPNYHIKEYYVAQKCPGFFVHKEQWHAFEKDFSSYLCHQEVGPVRYYKRS